MNVRAATLTAVLLGLAIGPVATTLNTPVPATCQTEPVSVERLARLIATPVAASPVSYLALEGAPADRDVVRAVEQTIYEVVACFNGGEPLRAYAFYTDGYLRSILAHQSIEDLQGLATPSPVDHDDWTVVIDIRDIRLLDDGRIYATVVLDPGLIPVQKMFGFFLIQQDSRWMVDDVLDELRFSLP
ncbi:hypothetical protein BH23CHL4_BH23CHL4_30610 [soil metagenome]